MKKIYIIILSIFLFCYAANSQQVVTGEYFFNTDPGFGNANPISFTADSTVSIDSIPINVTGLAIGYQWLYVRVKDSNNNWSNYRKQRFYVYDNSPIVQPVDTPKLVQAEYWIDSLAIAGTGTLINLTPDDTIFYNDSIPGLQLDTGGHVVSVRVKDSKGNWSFIKTDSVRIEVYDVDIDVASSPFYRAGFWGKMEVSLKNRGNKDIYDAFVMIKTTNIDSIMLTSETDSLYGFPYKSASPIVPFNGIDFAPVWLYKLPQQAITKFNLYVKFNSTSLLVGKMPLEFDVMYDDEIQTSRFLSNGDTSAFYESTLFRSFRNLVYDEQLNQVNFNLPDSIVGFKIDSCLKKVQNLFMQPILLSKIVKPLINQGFNLNISDSITNAYRESVLLLIKGNFYTIQANDTSISQAREAQRNFSNSCDPCPTCVQFSNPLTSNNNTNLFFKTSRACIQRCYCKCIGNKKQPRNQLHEGYDLGMSTSPSSSRTDWDNGLMQVKAVTSGTVTSSGVVPGFGNHVEVETPCSGGVLRVTYSHLSNACPIVSGGSVTAGVTVIGCVGGTGSNNTTTANDDVYKKHLHIEIYHDGVLCNSESIFSDYHPVDKLYDDKTCKKLTLETKTCDDNTTIQTEDWPSCEGTKPKLQEDGKCPTQPTDEKCKDPKVLNNWDPNDKVGNEGYATPRYIKPTDELQYGVLFQNVDTAQVPTHVVNIKDTLDLTKVNASTFYFESITAGEMLIVLPDTVHLQNIDTLYKEVPINNCYVHAVADFNSLTGAVEFTLTSVETSDTIPPYTPVTGVFEGFLPPDTTDFHGNGLVSFKVMPVSTIPDDTVIYNTAHIIFDSNPAIVTSTWFNTIDRIEPISNVIPLPSITYDTSFVVSWTGTDDGAGIAAYDIYSKKSSDTIFTKWLSYTSLVADTFHGVWNDTLQFYSIAYDSVGNVENKLALIEASTILQDPVGINYVYNSSALKIYPNPTTGKLIIEAELEKNGKLNFEIYNLLNQKLLSFEEDDISQKFIRKEIDISNQTDGVYFIRLNVDGQNITKKFILKKN